MGRAPPQWGLRALLALLLIAVSAHPLPALAHASLLGSDPPDGVVLAEPPATMRLDFNEPVSPLVFRLIGPSGEATTPKVSAENTTVTVTPPPAMRRGTQVLSWRVVSADGHPVGGSVIFSIGAASGAPPLAPATDPAVAVAIWALRLLIFLGLFVGAGGAAFKGLMAQRQGLPRPVEGLVRAALIGGGLAALMSIALQGVDALAQPLGQVFSADVWMAGLRTSYGATAILAALTSLLGFAGMRARSRWGGGLLAAGALAGVGLTLASSGHASTVEPQRLSRAIVFLHGACVAFWIGSLLPLAAIVRNPGRGGDELKLFSRVIPFPLAALVATGTYLILVQLDRPDALWTTFYGEILSGKLIAVLALLVLAAANRYLLVPRFQSHLQPFPFNLNQSRSTPRPEMAVDSLHGACPDRRTASTSPGHALAGARRPLVLSLFAESGMALAILGTVALWRFAPPPRALIAAEPASIHFHGGKAMVQIEVEPVRARGAEISIEVLDGEFRPLSVKEVAMQLSNAGAGIEPLRRDAARTGNSTWRIDDLRIPVQGRWSLRVDILINDFEKETLEDDVLLPRAP
jgi:copper transport protein